MIIFTNIPNWDTWRQNSMIKIDPHPLSSHCGRTVVGAGKAKSIQNQCDKFIGLGVSYSIILESCSDLKTMYGWLHLQLWTIEIEFPLTFHWQTLLDIFELIIETLRRADISANFKKLCNKFYGKTLV